MTTRKQIDDKLRREHVPRLLSHSELADVLRVTMRIGVLMLRSGAASFRTEQVMTRVAEVLGAERLESYVTPTGIIATVFSGREHRTQIMKIPNLGVDMNRVIALELLSRHLTLDTTPETLEAQLDSIEAIGPLYRQWQVVLAVGLGCGSFALILGGGPLEFIGAALGAMAAQIIRVRMIRLRFNPIPITVVCSAVATATSYAFAQFSSGVLGPALGLTPYTRLGVIASVLLLVPGVPLVTAVLDLTRLDLVSGVARGTYALILLVSIGIGMLAILAWTGLSIL